jgi:hypothetical protein
MKLVNMLFEDTWEVTKVYLDGEMELHLVYCAMDMVANGF